MNVKDILGRELNVGDKVVLSSPYGSNLQFAMVSKITSNRIYFKDYKNYNYGPNSFISLNDVADSNNNFGSNISFRDVNYSNRTILRIK